MNSVSSRLICIIDKTRQTYLSKLSHTHKDISIAGNNVLQSIKDHLHHTPPYTSSNTQRMLDDGLNQFNAMMHEVSKCVHLKNDINHNNMFIQKMSYTRVNRIYDFYMNVVNRKK